MAHASDVRARLREAFGGSGEIFEQSVPGRVNLIGEHIDYHGLPVLPMAVRRHVRRGFRPRQDRMIRAVSEEEYGAREFEWTRELKTATPGDWQNYLRAAAQLVSSMGKVKPDRLAGIDAAIVSD